MSDFGIGLEDLDGGAIFEPAAKRDETSADERKRDKLIIVVKVFIFVLLLCGVLEILFYKFVIPSLGSPIVSVKGQGEYSASEIVDTLRPMNARTWFGFDVKAATSIIASVPGIDSVSVRKVFPNKIYVELKEREGVAMTFIERDERSVAVQIDRNGVIFPEYFGSNSNFDASSLPIISGLPVEHLGEGMRIPLKYRTLIEQIANIRAMPKNYFAAISEICVVPKDSGSFELVLIPVNAKIRVLADRALNEDALKYMMVVLDVVKSTEPDVSEIDLRYGSVSYRKR